MGRGGGGYSCSISEPAAGSNIAESMSVQKEWAFETSGQGQCFCFFFVRVWHVWPADLQSSHLREYENSNAHHAV